MNASHYHNTVGRTTDNLTADYDDYELTTDELQAFIYRKIAKNEQITNTIRKISDVLNITCNFLDKMERQHKQRETK